MSAMLECYYENGPHFPKSHLRLHSQDVKGLLNGKPSLLGAVILDGVDSDRTRYLIA